MVIARNTEGAQLHRIMRNISSEMSQSMLRIATGKRINFAKDDPAGLAISEGMRAQLRGLSQAWQNTMDTSSLINVAEGGLSGIVETLQRLREITVQAANDSTTASQRGHLQREVYSLLKEINANSKGTQFNSFSLLDGSLQKTDYSGTPFSAMIHNTQLVASMGESVGEPLSFFGAFAEMQSAHIIPTSPFSSEKPSETGAVTINTAALSAGSGAGWNFSGGVLTLDGNQTFVLDGIGGANGINRIAVNGDA
ncbi:MAG: flagellin, partial [Defluviitaleaceae bacterium]|nr:flagellin [Defluviitaleaceae bacterium]